MISAVTTNPLGLGGLGGLGLGNGVGFSRSWGGGIGYGGGYATGPNGIPVGGFKIFPFFF